MRREGSGGALLYDPDLEVRTEALLYLTEHSNVDPAGAHRVARRLRGLLDSAAMVAFLARPGRAQNVDAARLMLSKMVEESGRRPARGSKRRG